MLMCSSAPSSTIVAGTHQHVAALLVGGGQDGDGRPRITVDVLDLRPAESAVDEHVLSVIREDGSPQATPVWIDYAITPQLRSVKSAACFSFRVAIGLAHLLSLHARAETLVSLVTAERRASFPLLHADARRYPRRNRVPRRQ
jgi:hypothetical protein